MATNENKGAPENEADAPDFSRAAARRRWEAEGIADEVYNFRVKTRKRLQAEGLTKKQAGEEMWKLALETYPSPERKREQQLESMLDEIHQSTDVIRDRGEHPPANIAKPQAGELDFSDVWAVFYHAVASHHCVERVLDMHSRLDPDGHRRYSVYEARQQATAKLRIWHFHQSKVMRKSVLAWAIIELFDFLAHAETVFKAELERQNQLDESDEAIEQIEEALGELTTIRQPRVQPVFKGEAVSRPEPLLAEYA